MHLITLIYVLSVGFAKLSVSYLQHSPENKVRLIQAQSAALCDSVNATPAENVFGQRSNLKAPAQQHKKSKRALLVCEFSLSTLTYTLSDPGPNCSSRMFESISDLFLHRQFIRNLPLSLEYPFLHQYSNRELPRWRFDYRQRLYW